MKYFWTECPGCGCQVTVQWTEAGEKVSGSLRRWSTDRNVNDGRRFEAVATPAGGGFVTACVCGQEIAVTEPSAVAATRDAV